jgi:hypothetical protein
MIILVEHNATYALTKFHQNVLGQFSVINVNVPFPLKKSEKNTLLLNLSSSRPKPEILIIIFK